MMPPLRSPQTLMEISVKDSAQMAVSRPYLPITMLAIMTAASTMQ